MTTTGAGGGRISAVEVTPVAFADPPLLNAAGVHQPWALRTIVRVQTDDGLVGLGETYGDENVLEPVRRAAGQLPGLSPYDLAGMRFRVLEAAGRRGPAVGDAGVDRVVARIVAPFEVALLDIQGRACGQPVHALLGGRVRARVPFSAYLFYKWSGHPGTEPDDWGAALDPDGIVAQAGRMVERFGFGSLKLKGGVFPPAQEVEAVRALHAAFPDRPVRIDPNAAWTVPTAKRVAADLAETLEYLEDPTPGRGGMAEVAAAAAMPLATNMCVVAFADVPEAVRLGSVGVVLADHHYWGGLRASGHLAALCETFGIGLSMHSNSHLGISLAAMTHLAAATPNLTYACDTHAPWATEDVVENPLPIVDGAVRVPDGPGLGVRTDPEALGRMHEQYRRSGQVRREDAAYMRRFDPDFTPRRAFW